MLILTKQALATRLFVKTRTSLEGVYRMTAFGNSKLMLERTCMLIRGFRFEHYYKKNQFLKMTGVILSIIMFSVIVTACNERQQVIEERIPTFLDIEYIYSMEGATVPGPRSFEGTAWFGAYGVHLHRISEEVRNSIEQRYHITLPETIKLETNSNSFIGLSIGRRLKNLYYFEDNVRNGGIVPGPIFEKDYYPNTIFIYRVSPLPVSRFVCNVEGSNNVSQFLQFDNIPFDVWVYPASVKKELSPSLNGYIDTEETYLREYPTRNSRILRRLEEKEEIDIIAYVEGGESIDESSRWYYVTLISNDLTGYIHSSFISYFED
jgi:hypothetical protein